MLLLILNIVAIVNLLLFMGLLLTRRYRNRSNKFLAFIIVNAILTMILNLFMYYKLLDKFPVILYLAYLMEFLWAPFLYYYIQMLLQKEVKFSYRKILHFTLFIGVGVFFIWFLFQTDSYRQKMIVGLQENNIPLEFKVINYLSVLQFLIFITAGYLDVLKSKEQIKQFLSKTDNIATDWLQKFIPTALVLCIIMYIPITFSTKLQLYLIVIPLSSLVIYFYLVYKAISTPLLFAETTKLIDEKIDDQSIDKSSKLTNEQFYGVKEVIESSFLVPKLYLDSAIDIKAFARVCNIKVYILSAFINQHYNKSFFDFVNYFRIEEAKKMLSDPEKKNYSIDTIAERAGFSSRSAFYKAFKKNTGLTPREYIKSE